MKAIPSNKILPPYMPQSCCRLSTKEVLFNEAVSQVQTLLALLEAILPTMPASPEARSPAAYERHFLYSLAWSLGGLLEPNDRLQFDLQMRSIRRGAMPDVRKFPPSSTEA